MQETHKPLISAAVLGLIFEKLNGYQDGSFYTPGFITMYMARHTLRRAVVQHFNRRYGYQATDIPALADALDAKNRVPDSAYFNTLTVLDPAVGSGHFLVSALNELLAIKAELGLLLDDAGKRLRYRLTVARDELVVVHEDDDPHDPAALFQYHARLDPATGQRTVAPAHTNLQRALFHDKRHLIEHALFGVDINPNSVRICRLRLWVELLKHAYYIPDTGFAQLETLPNLDLNIKTGNSLLSRFDLTADLSKFKQGKFNFAAYLEAKHAYFVTRDRAEKQRIQVFLSDTKEQLTATIYRGDPLRRDVSTLKSNLLQVELDAKPDMFGKTKITEEVAWERTAILNIKLSKAEAKLAEREKGIFFRNAFEWRFEFPEVLDDRGQFQGFDVVIGNPPYITKIQDSSFKNYLMGNFKTSQYQLDLYVAFIEKSVDLLKQGGLLSFITPNSWLKNMMFSELRKFALENLNILEIVANMPSVFTEASVDSAILTAEKNNQNQLINIIKLSENSFNITHTADSKRFHTNERLVFDIEMDNTKANIIHKMRKNKESLQQICDITRGVNPYDKARGQSKDIISSRAYHAVVKKDDTFVPELRGKHIKPYQYKWDGTSFISYGSWLAAPREPKYFNGPRLIMRQVLGKTLFCTIIEERMIIDQSIFIAKIKPEFLHNHKLEYILGILASTILAIYFKNTANEFDELFPKIKIGEFRELPIPHATPAQQAEIAALVEQVLAAKAAGEPTSTLEADIDALVAVRYGLTPAEVAQLGA